MIFILYEKFKSNNVHNFTMIKTLTLATIITSVILVSGTLGFVIGSPDVFASLTPTNPECQECNEDRVEQITEAIDEWAECVADADDPEELIECDEELDEKVAEANAERAECLEECSDDDDEDDDE